MLFLKFDVNRMDWINLVFENRNQAYGAFVLRRDSSQNLKKALLIACVFFSALVLTAYSVFWFKTKLSVINADVLKPNDPILKITDVQIKEIKKNTAPLAVASEKA